MGTLSRSQADTLGREIDSCKQYLYSLSGIQHAEALVRAAAPSPGPSPASGGGEAGAAGGVGGSGQSTPADGVEAARRITQANLEICERNRWEFLINMCHRVLGDIDAVEGQQAEARAHYDQALRIARTITRRDVLIEALIARGRHAGRAHAACAEPPAGLLQTLNLDQAFADLREGLELVTRGGYRRYEADADRARAEAQRARALSQEMGYHWGRVDAAEALAAL